MPNHVHGILINRGIICRDAINGVSMSETTQSKQSGGITGIKNLMFDNSISRVVRWFKGRVSYEIRKSYSGFHWQNNFYDHIIRDQKSFHKIEQYIKNNVSKWDEERFNLN